MRQLCELVAVEAVVAVTMISRCLRSPGDDMQVGEPSVKLHGSGEGKGSLDRSGINLSPAGQCQERHRQRLTSESLDSDGIGKCETSVGAKGKKLSGISRFGICRVDEVGSGSKAWMGMGNGDGGAGQWQTHAHCFVAFFVASWLPDDGVHSSP